MRARAPSLFASVLLVAVALTKIVQAGPLEDGLLAGSADRLDVKGVELALHRGAKAAKEIPLPAVPSVVRTPVQYALRALIGADEPDAVQRAERILRVLFKAGAKLTGERDELFSAISGGHDRIVVLLLEQGANPHARIYGYTPAELAIKYDRPTLLPVFYSRGVPKVDAEAIAQIQLVHAASRQRLPAMRAAVAAGAKIGFPDPAGALALVQVFSMPLNDPYGYEAAAWLLGDANADASAVEYTEDKSTALHKLIERNSYRNEDHIVTAAIAETLLRRGANVSSVDFRGRTPLHYAAERGNTYVMQVLIRYGAKVMTRDEANKSPMDLAASGEAISLLRAAGARE